MASALSDNKLFTIQEVANILGVSTKTLRRWDQRGRFVPTRTAGNQRRYTQEQVSNLKSQISNLKNSVRAEEESLTKEFEPAHSLPSALNGLPSGSVLKRHFLLQSEAKTFAKIRARETESTLAGGISRLGLFKAGLLFAGLVLFFSLAGAVIMTRYNTLAIFSQKKAQFAKFIDNLPQINFNTKSQNLSIIPQEDEQAVLAAATGGSDLRLNVSVPSIFSEIATFSAGLNTDNHDINAGTGTLTASNVLYGAIAGTGISISTGQTPTVTNTGVISLGGKTGTVALAAGTDISISDVTINNKSTLSSVRGRGGCTDCIVDNDVVNSLTISSSGNVSGTAITSGTVGTTVGGTGLTSYTTGDLLYASAANTLSKLAIGTSGQILTTSAGSIPTWSSSAQALVTIEESNVTINNAGTLNFLGGDFDLSESPSGQANIQLATTLTTPTGVSGNWDIGGTLTAGTSNAFSVSAAGTITIPATEDITFGSVGLNDVGTSNTTSGASKVGVYDELANSSGTNIQDVLDDLDAAIGAGSSKWSQDTGFVYLANTTDDVVIGGSTVAGANLYFDESASNLYLGTNASANGILTLYSSGASITDPTITTDSSGNLVIDSVNFDVTTTGINSTAIGQTTAAAGSFTTLTTTGTTTLGDGAGDTVTLTALSTAGPVITNASGVISSEAQLAIARGGTNSTATPTQGGIAYGTGTAYAFSSAGTTGTAVLSGGTGSPTFTTGTLALAGNFATSGTSALTLTTTGATNATLPSGTVTLADLESAQTFSGAKTFTTTTTLTYSGTENLALTTDLATTGTLNTFSVIGTPSSSNGTTRGIFVQQADSANSNGLDTALYIDNADAGLAITTGIQLANSGGGGYTTLLDTPSLDISGAGAITGATGITSSGTITLSGLTTDGIVKVASGVLSSEAQLALSRGGTNKNLTAAAGGIVYTDADSMEVTAAGTSGQCLQSNGASAPSWGGCDISATTPFTVAAGIIDKTTVNDRLRLLYGDAADTQLTIENTTNSTIPSVDAMQIDLTGGTTGIVTDGADGLLIATEFGNGTTNTNSGLHLDINPVNTPSGDETFAAILIDALAAGTSAQETAVSIGANWDTVLDSANLDISGAGVITGATGITSSGTITLSGLTASRAVFTNGSSALTSSADSSVLVNSINDETGTGVLVFATSPTLVTPNIGVATATSVNKLAITAPATSATLAIADGKTFTASNTLTLTGTDSTSFTFPSTTGGTVITSNTPTQAITSTQTSGTLLALSDSTALTGAIIGQSISLTGANAQDQTGLKITLSGASGSNLNALVVNNGTSDTAYLSKNGVLSLGASSANTGQLIFRNATDTDTTTLQSSTSQTQAAITYTLPVTDGNSNEVLITDGSGVLSWTTVSGIGAGGDITGVGDVTTGLAFTGGAADGNTGNNLYFEGTTADDVEVVLTAADATSSDKTITLPNLTGTVALLENSQTFTGAKSFTGGVTLGAASSNTGSLTFAHASHAFTNVLQSSGSQTQNVTYTLPVDDGSSNYVLSTDGSGVLSWQSISGVGAGTGDITAVGSMTTGDAFADTSADDDWLGLGASAGRIEFDDQTIDEINLLANVGIGTSTPTSPLNVNNPTFTVTADASQAVVDISGALTEAASGTHARLVGVNITPPTITGGVGAVTNTASLYISDAPSASGATNYALWADSGNVRFDGTITAGSANEVITLSTGKIDADALSRVTVAADALSSTTNSPSGLETVSDQLTLLQGCNDANFLAWDETNDYWACSSPTTSVVTISEGVTQYTGENELVFNATDFDVSDAGTVATVTVDYTNFGTRASPLNIGDATGTRTIDLGGVSNDGTDTINIATNGSTNADTITIGNSNASTTLALTGGDDWSLTATGVLTLSASAAQTTALIITDTDYTNALSIGDNNILGTTSAIDFTNFDIAATGALTLLGGLSPDITTQSNNNLTLTVNGTGDLAFTLDADTQASFNSTVASDVTLNAVDVNMTDTGAASTGTLNLLAVRNLNEAGATGTPDSLIYAVHADADETVTNGIFIENTAAGTLTNGIQIKETAGTITDGILISGTLANILNSDSLDITGAGAITGATGFNGLVVTANSGTITTGTWNGTTIGAQYGGTGINTSASTGVPSISSGTWSVNTVLPLSLGGTNKNITASNGQVVYTDTDSFELTSSGSTGQCLTYNSGSAPTWAACDSSATTPFTVAAGIIDKTTVNDRLRLLYGDAADTQLTIENTTNSTIPSVDAMQIDLTGGTTGIVTDGADGLLIATEFGNGTTNTNSGLHLDINPVNTPSGDETFAAILIDALAAGTSAQETAVSIGANWDTVLDSANLDISGAGVITGATGITSSGTITLSGLTTDGIVKVASGVLSSEAQLAITRGGTNSTATPTQGGIAYGTGTAYAFSSAGTTGTTVLSGGTGSPTFTTGTLALAGNFATSGTSALTLTTTGTTNATLPSGTVTLADLESAQTFTGAKTFTPSSTNDITFNMDADSTFARVFSSGTTATAGSTHSITNSASSGTIAVIGETISLAGTANATGANTITGINFANVTALTNNTFNGITFGTGFDNFITSPTIDISAAGAITSATGFNGLVVTANNGTITTGIWNGTAIGAQYGGTGATTLTSNGVLYGNGTSAVGVTTAGTDGQILIGNTSAAPAFASMSSDATITSAGVLTIAANAVALSTDTTGNYVATVAGGSGISVSDSGSENAAVSLAFGALSADWNQTGAFDIRLNSASSELRILESSGDTYYGSIDVTDLSADRTFTFPDATGTVCLSTGNCSGGGSAVNGSGTANELTYWSDSDTITSDNVLQIDATNDVLGIGLGTASIDTAALLDIYGESEIVLLRPANIASDADADTNNSPTLRLRGTYDSDVAIGPVTSSNFNFDIRNTMTAAGNSPASRLGFINNAGTEVASILSGGSMGIGATSPLGTLDVRPNLTNGGTIAIASVSGSTSFAALLADNTGVGDLFTASKSGATKFVIANSGNVGIGTAAPGTTLDVTGTGRFSSTLTASNGFTQTTGTARITSNSTGNTPSPLTVDWNSSTIQTNNLAGISIDPTNLSTVNTDAAFFAGLQITGVGTQSLAKEYAIYQNGTAWDYGLWMEAGKNYLAGSVGIGATSPLGTLDVRPNLTNGGTIAIASVSGSTSFAALLADNTGSGDLFTASKSGATKFAILNNGNLSFAGTTNFLSTIASAATAARTWTFPDATGTLCTSAANCAFDAFWNSSSGALYPGNSTLDLLIGATSTASAKFGFINVAGGNPTATISGNLSLVVPTTAGANTFNLLNNSTLNFQRSPGGDADLASNSVLFLGNNGNVGIGTAAPTARLSVAGTSSTISNSLGNLTITPSSNLIISSGNVGIINTTPLTALDVTGSASLSANLSLRGAATAHTFNILQNGTLNIQRSPGGDAGLATALFIQNNGNIGIGINTPLLRLDVQDSQSATAAAQIFNTNSGTDADGLILKLGNTSTSAVASTNHFLSFETFGIGIVGSVQGSGGTGVTYATSGIADFAEYFKKEESEVIEYGSLVCLKDSGMAVKCDGNNSQILGVASERPAFLGGENLGNKSIAVGLVGQVQTLVSTASGIIQSGDVLTMSSTPGVAVKATKAGQIIGKAVEGFAGTDIGRIQVSVNISWYDPSIYIAADGSLVQNTQNTQIANASGTQIVGQSDVSDSLSFQSSLKEDSLFMDLQSKVSALELKTNILMQKVDQQASVSAFLLDIQNGSVLGASASAALDIGDIQIQSATISADLMVLGRTTLSDLGVTGNINAGLLSISGLSGEINTLAGDIKLQSLGLGGIDILNGKIAIDIQGNLVVKGEITAKKINIETQDKESAAVGSGIMTSGDTSSDIFSTAVTADSKIFVTATTPTGRQSLFVKEKTAGIGFTINIEQPYYENIAFDWWVVN